jgi:hypothetical protein
MEKLLTIGQVAKQLNVTIKIFRAARIYGKRSAQRRKKK